MNFKGVPRYIPSGCGIQCRKDRNGIPFHWEAALSGGIEPGILTILRKRGSPQL